MGRKLPGLIQKTLFKKMAKFYTLRIAETSFSPRQYGYLAARMIQSIAATRFKLQEIKEWGQDLLRQSQEKTYYFAIDLNVALLRKPIFSI